MKESPLSRKLTILLLAALAVALFGCTPKNRADGHNTLTQYSTLGSLMNGVYDSEMTLGQLSQYGDFGLGTFQHLDGEMVVLDGCFYQVASDGKVHTPEPTVKAPFAVLTWFKPGQEISLPAGTNFKSAEEALDRALPSRNLFYAVRIEGTFAAMKTRSVPRQSPPYPPLAEVAKSQPVFQFQNIEGVLVGFRCPAYSKGVNAPGWHMHFLSRDKQAGGHMLDFTTVQAAAKIETINEWTTMLPAGGDFYSTNLEASQSQDLKRVER